VNGTGSVFIAFAILRPASCKAGVPESFVRDFVGHESKVVSKQTRSLNQLVPLLPRQSHKRPILSLSIADFYIRSITQKVYVLGFLKWKFVAGYHFKSIRSRSAHSVATRHFSRSETEVSGKSPPQQQQFFTGLPCEFGLSVAAWLRMEFPAHIQSST
jgi:hypothetical protein